MKQIILCLALAAAGSKAIAQPVTVTFKPGPTVGEDAGIFMLDNNCIMEGQTVTPADANRGNIPELHYMDWTWRSHGCQSGTTRGLFRFAQLSGIPTNAVILSATLTLHGVSSSPESGNSSYPSSPYTNTNPGWLSRVTSAWTEAGVTWNTQPTTTTTGAIAIPATTSRWNWNWTTSSADLVTMVQDWVSNPATNFGFQLRLQTEVHYRKTVFASSDHTDSTLWPELTVTYEVCDANFTYCASSSNPSGYSFTSSSPGTAYSWTVNGDGAGATSSMSYLFPSSGTYTVCLTKATQRTRCRECIDLCISRNQTAQQSQSTSGTTSAGPEQSRPASPQAKFIAPDLVLPQNIKVTPNPSNNDWNLSFDAESAMPVSVSLYDASGKLIRTIKVQVKEGKNSLNQEAASLASGIYFIEIKSEHFVLREKAVKL